MEPQEASPLQLLEALVSVVATLGEVAATVTGSHRGEQQRMSPDSLEAALRRFTQSLRETLHHSSVPSLGQALATFSATSWITWTDVRAVAKGWQKLVAALRSRWDQLALEAAKLCVACVDAAPAQARDLWYKTARRGTAWHTLAATAWQPPVALDWEEVAWVGATHNVREAAATDEEEEVATSEEEVATSEEEVATSEEEVATSEEEVATSEEEVATSEEEVATSEEDVATSEEEVAISEEELATRMQELAPSEEDLAPSKEEVATRSDHWAEVALGPLERLVDACERASMFIRHMDYCLSEIMIILSRTKKASPNVPVALVAKVAEAEQLWEASSRLTKDRLLGILDLIDNLLLSPYGGPGGPGSGAVDERCQEAIKNIPRLLQGQ